MSRHPQEHIAATPYSATPRSVFYELPVLVMTAKIRQRIATEAPLFANGVRRDSGRLAAATFADAAWNRSEVYICDPRPATIVMPGDEARSATWIAVIEGRRNAVAATTGTYDYWDLNARLRSMAIDMCLYESSRFVVVPRFRGDLLTAAALANEDDSKWLRSQTRAVTMQEPHKWSSLSPRRKHLTATTRTGTHSAIVPETWEVRAA